MLTSPISNPAPVVNSCQLILAFRCSVTSGPSGGELFLLTHFVFERPDSGVLRISVAINGMPNLSAMPRQSGDMIAVFVCD